MSRWTQVLELDAQRHVVSGETDALVAAVRSGADLRIGTGFRHNEHIDTSSDREELIREVMDFRVTYLLEDRWVAGEGVDSGCCCEELLTWIHLQSGSKLTLVEHSNTKTPRKEQ